MRGLRHHLAVAVGATLVLGTTLLATSVGAVGTGVSRPQETVVPHTGDTGSISGTVAGDASQYGICIDAYTSIGGSLVSGTVSYPAPGTGTYTISGLAAGNYYVIFSNCDAVNNQGDEDYQIPYANYAYQYYNDTSTGTTVAADATTVAVSTGNTPDINATMVAGGAITAEALYPTQDLSQICVNLYLNGVPIPWQFSTLSEGAYITGLPVGNYVVSFSSGCGNSTDWPTIYYVSNTASTPNEDDATPVSVAAGTTTQVDGIYPLDSSISGTVTSSAGTALSGICVQALGAGDEEASTITASDGSYSLTGLYADRYTVEFYPGPSCGNTTNYVDEYYNGTSTGTPVLGDASDVSVGEVGNTVVNA
ncbi:MAG: carboxypeptidase-like regulatory domain-containing protein, partial [Acidimicrobiales bacterium]